MPFTFTVTTQSKDRHGLQLRDSVQRFCNALRIPDNLTPEQAEEFALDYFRRCINDELVLLAVECGDEPS